MSCSSTLRRWLLCLSRTVARPRPVFFHLWLLTISSVYIFAVYPTIEDVPEEEMQSKVYIYNIYILGNKKIN